MTTTRAAWTFAMSLAAAACSSPKEATPCAPNRPVSGGGTVHVVRTDGDAAYALTTAQVEDFINSGTLTITAGNADAGAGGLQASDPVVLVRMDPAPDKAGTYPLATLHAKVAYCPSASARFVVANGAVTGCAPSGALVDEPLVGTLTVTSTSQKSVDAPVVGGGHVSVEAQYGTQDQTCSAQ